MTLRDALKHRFVTDHGWGDAQMSFLAGDASSRSYDRLVQPDGTRAVLMDAPPDKGENTAPFVRIAAHLRNIGLSAPQIFAQDAEHGFLLIEDFGDALFARLMRDDPAREIPLYETAVDVLVHLHAAPVLEVPVCNADWLCDATSLAFDHYARTDAAPFLAAFRPLAERLDAVQKVLILRDYHAENLIYLPERTGPARAGLLDFQDALLGHPAYDLVSILQDARRDIAPATEAAMIAHYLRHTPQPEAEFKAAYAILGAQRNLRILGIFARLSAQDGKHHYLDYVPRVWGYLHRNLRHPALAEVASALRPILPEPTPAFIAHLRGHTA